MENVVHETLESGGSIGETLRHDEPFEGSISCLKGGLPFISGGNPDEMVGMLEVNLGINVRGSGTVQEIRDEGEWITVLFGNAIKSAEVHAESQRTILFLDKEDRSTVRRCQLANKAMAEIFVQEFAEFLEFGGRQGVDRTWRGRLSFFQFNLQVVRPIRWKYASGNFAEHGGIFVVLRQDCGEVWQSG